MVSAHPSEKGDPVPVQGHDNGTATLRVALPHVLCLCLVSISMFIPIIKQGVTQFWVIKGVQYTLWSLVSAAASVCAMSVARPGRSPLALGLCFCSGVAMNPLFWLITRCATGTWAISTSSYFHLSGLAPFLVPGVVFALLEVCSREAAPPEGYVEVDIGEQHSRPSDTVLAARCQGLQECECEPSFSGTSVWTMWNPSPEGGQCLPGACSRQTRLALANLLFWALLYSILTTYAQSFRTFKRTHAGSSGLSTLLIWYISFMLLIQALTVIGKRIGSLVDEGKRGTFSLYFSNELCCSLFYFVFYRSLFELISSVWEFLLICIVHMLQEWVFYPCRCTSTAFEWYHWLNRKFEGHPTLQWAVVAAFMPPEGKTLRHLEYFVATDKCLRSAAFVFTTVTFNLQL
eukprot:TRINITY_DN1450_c0_g1_i13.p1 TRINITY_DN1450_c0_g1~~TRINITY_DN1450_c0_g1_i13.p1  ORF type:complete len:403 (-),score=50.51 TRINITY_DN1450_c0_g1_i13:323-1531(-)